MSKLKQLFSGFFGITTKIQSYINLLYLLGSFPLGVFYFVFLAIGLSTGLSLTIIWIGIPVLIFVFIGWLSLAKLERFIVINLLKEKIPVIEREYTRDVGLWENIRILFCDPFSWNSLIYLLFKFPLGILSFGILATLVSLTVVLISLPFSYRYIQFFQVSIPILAGKQIFEITNIKVALVGTLLGFILWPTTLYIAKGLTLLHVNSAKLFLKEIS